MDPTCLFCCDKCDCCATGSICGFKTGKVVSLFFKLIWRYLAPHSGGNWEELPNPETQIHTCAKCLQIVLSLCDLYHEMKTVELQLNWKLKTLVRFMQNDQENTENGCGDEAGENYDKINELRKSLKEKCSAKFSKPLPKVKLARMQAKNGKPDSETETVELSLPKARSILLNQSSGELLSNNDIMAEMDENNEYEGAASPNLSLDSEMTTSKCFEPNVRNSDNLQPADTKGKNDDVLNDSTTATPVNSVFSNQSGKFKFKCDICFKPITDRWKLNRHLKTHKGRISKIPKTTETSKNKKKLSMFPKIKAVIKVEVDQTLETSEQLEREILSPLPLTTEVEPDNDSDVDFELDDDTTTDTSCSSDDDDDDDYLLKSARPKGTAVASKNNSHAPQEKRFSCKACAKGFRERSTLNRHCKTKLHEKKAKLYNLKPVKSTKNNKDDDYFAKCNKPKATMIPSNDNPRIPVIKRFNCDICAKTYDHRYQLNRHRETKKHEKKSKNHLIQMCSGEKLSHNSNMVSHSPTESSRDRDQTTDPECQICHKIFHSYNLLTRHQNKAHGIPMPKIEPKPARLVPPEYCFKCPDPECSKLFKQLHSLILHRKQKTTGSKPEEKNLKVEIVDVTTSEHHRHLATVEAPTEVFICEVKSCGRALYSEADLQDHSKLHGEFKCSICPEAETFSYAPDLAMHELAEQQKHKKEKRVWPCSRCQKDFRLTRHYKYHFVTEHLGLQLSSRMVEYLCGICRMFEASYRLTRHYVEEHNVDKVDIQKCGWENCNAYFNHWIPLMLHHKAHHSKSHPKVTCPDCPGGRLYFTNTLKAHRRIVHSSNFIFKCKFHPKCRIMFETEAEKEEHFQNHHRGKDNPEFKKCPKCDREFDTEKYLRSHIKSHHEKLPFICETCGKSFKDKSRLQVHSLGHTSRDLWEFPCDICGKRFATKDRMLSHKKLHAGEKPFVCEICGVKYAQKCRLVDHMKNKHGTGK